MDTQSVRDATGQALVEMQWGCGGPTFRTTLAPVTMQNLHFPLPCGSGAAKIDYCKALIL